MKQLKYKKTFVALMSCFAVVFSTQSAAQNANKSVNQPSPPSASTQKPGVTQPAQPTSAAPAAAAPVQQIVPFVGSTLERIKSTGTIIIGHRSGSIPVSYKDAGRPIGYALDICNKVALRVRDRLAMQSINIEYVEVDSSNRIPNLISGKVDLECGSTTNNADRRKQVDFSIPYYIAGVRILTRKDTGIREVGDLKGKIVAMGKGTSAVKIVERLNKERDLRIQIKEAPDFDAALREVQDKKADAFILDDLLLYGARSQAKNPDDLVVVGDFLSIEPLAVMIRKNDRIKPIVDRVIYEMMSSGELNSLYSKWFEQAIPPKANVLNIPQSGLLKDVFRAPIDQVGD